MAILLAAAVLAGIGACIVDGETFHLDSCKGTTVKLWGIDAPPRGDKFAGDATVALSRLIDRQQLRCEEKGKASKAIVAQCWLGQQDLAEILVSRGWAKPVAKTGDAYAAAANRARAEKRGVWAVERVAAAPAARAPVEKAAVPARPAARPIERRIGEVTVVDIEADPYVRLEGPRRELSYEQRLQLSSFVERQTKSQQYTLTVFMTHHDEAARAYAQAMSDAAEKLDIAPAVKANKQCVKNRDGAVVCFMDEGFAIALPHNLLLRHRKNGLRVQLAGGSNGAKPMMLTLDAAMIDGQLKASDEVVQTLKQ